MPVLDDIIDLISRKPVGRTVNRKIVSLSKGWNAENYGQEQADEKSLDRLSVLKKDLELLEESLQVKQAEAEEAKTRLESNKTMLD